MIKSINPIQAYLCDEGLARLCTENYVKPNQQNIKNSFIHLTNFSLNKQHENFKSPDDEFYKNDNGSKRLLSSVFKLLIQSGRDVKILKRQIKEITAKCIIALEPYLQNAYRVFVGDMAKPKCF